MKISFIIPAYNEEEYIGPCLESVIKDIEEFKEEVEIVVVNNASTDRTKEIALTYPGVRVVDEMQKGLTKARQAGYKGSTGELVANIDADNRLPSGWTKKVINDFENEKNIVAISGPVQYYDLSGFINLEVKVFYYLGYASYLINNYIFRKSGMIQGGNFVARRSALEKIGGFNTEIKFYGEDTDLAVRLRKVGPIKFTLHLPILSSGRRLSEEGVIITGIKYILNYFWMIIFKKPLNKKYSDIRKSA